MLFGVLRLFLGHHQSLKNVQETQSLKIAFFIFSDFDKSGARRVRVACASQNARRNTFFGPPLASAQLLIFGQTCSKTWLQGTTEPIYISFVAPGRYLSVVLQKIPASISI
eukprot:sb/3477240/